MMDTSTAPNTNNHHDFHTCTCSGTSLHLGLLQPISRSGRYVCWASTGLWRGHVSYRGPLYHRTIAILFLLVYLFNVLPLTAAQNRRSFPGEFMCVCVITKKARNENNNEGRAAI